MWAEKWLYSDSLSHASAQELFCSSCLICFIKKPRSITDAKFLEVSQMKEEANHHMQYSSFKKGIRSYIMDAGDYVEIKLQEE